MAFVPNNLPAQLEWTPDLVSALSDATLAVGQLCGAGLNLPNPNLLITPFLQRETEMSSRIEGTQAEFQDLYLFKMHERTAESRAPDVKEVANYVRALEYGLKRIHEIPVCLRLIRELHQILLTAVRGAQRMPGKFRKVQNRIGPKPIDQAIYVPPPPEKIPNAFVTQ